VAATLAWVVLLGVGQLLLGGRLVVVPWLALGPLAASLVARWRPTAVVAAASVLVVALLSARTGDLGTAQGVIRVVGSAFLAGFAVLSASVRVRREERVRRVAQVAAVAQTAILHPVPAQVGGVVMASGYVSATTDALVGGDLYDVVAVGAGVRIVVGDARGKGLDALHTSAAVLSAFRHAAPQASVGLDEVARSIEAAIAPRLSAEDFVTAALCEIRPGGRLDVVLCGHPAPLRLRPGSSPEEVGSHPGPPLGLGVDPRVESATLEPGDRLLLYTDGMVEARDAHGRFFDLEAAAAWLSDGPAASASTLDERLRQLFARVRAHVGGTLTDDVAALLVEPVPAG
jgi:serine phosphatase RsbU (regulator of sigma subunit)